MRSQVLRSIIPGLMCGIDQSVEPGVTDEPGLVLIHPDAVPQLIEHLQAALYRLRGPDLSGLKLRWPRDLKAFLHEDRPKPLKIKAAALVSGNTIIELKPLSELRAENLKVRPQVATWAREGPHAEDGYYAVPAVNLVQGNAEYSLLWLPTERRYGTYDPEHTELMVFRGKPTWTKVRAEIERYYAATNSGGDIEPKWAEYFCPWPTYPFVTDD